MSGHMNNDGLSDGDEEDEDLEEEEEEGEDSDDPDAQLFKGQKLQKAQSTTTNKNNSATNNAVVKLESADKEIKGKTYTCLNKYIQLDNTQYN